MSCIPLDHWSTRRLYVHVYCSYFILVIISCVLLHVLHLLVVSRILPTSLGVGALSSLIEPCATIYYPRASNPL